jgi:hypothetical protein
MVFINRVLTDSVGKVRAGPRAKAQSRKGPGRRAMGYYIVAAAKTNMTVPTTPPGTNPTVILLTTKPHFTRGVWDVLKKANPIKPSKPEPINPVNVKVIASGCTDP